MGKCLRLSSYTSANIIYDLIALLNILADNHVDPAKRLAHFDAIAGSCFPRWT